MANQFINSSFTLRPSTNDRDRPELTLRQTEVSRIPRETTVTSHCGKWGRAFKRQRLFMDRSQSTIENSYYAKEDQYISEDDYNTPIIRRRVSCEFPSRHRICPSSSVSESNYWKTRCLGMQTFCHVSKNRLLDAEEDQRQLRQRIRELEEQLLLQTSRSNGNSVVSTDEGDATNHKILPDVEESIHRGDAAERPDEDMACTDNKESGPPTIVIEIKENHQAISSCLYMTDGEGLNDSYDLEMEEDDEDKSINTFRNGMLDDIDDDRNDINVNQRRG